MNKNILKYLLYLQQITLMYHLGYKYLAVMNYKDEYFKASWSMIKRVIISLFEITSSKLTPLPSPHVPQIESSLSLPQRARTFALLGVWDKNFHIFFLVKLLLLLTTPFVWRSTLNSMRAGKDRWERKNIFWIRPFVGISC